MGVTIQSHIDFKKFFEEFFPAVYAFLLRYTGEEELARDLTQEAFIKIYEKRKEIGDVQHAKAFLYTVARRLYWDHRKHQDVKNSYQVSVEKEDEYNFLKEVTQQETIRILHRAINQLPNQTRTIIQMNLQGKNNIEIAEVLNVSVNTVKSLKKNAYTILRGMLSEEYFILFFIIFSNNTDAKKKL